MRQIQKSLTGGALPYNFRCPRELSAIATDVLQWHCRTASCRRKFTNVAQLYNLCCFRGVSAIMMDVLQCAARLQHVVADSPTFPGSIIYAALGGSQPSRQMSCSALPYCIMLSLIHKCCLRYNLCCPRGFSAIMTDVLHVLPYCIMSSQDSPTFPGSIIYAALGGSQPSRQMSCSCVAILHHAVVDSQMLPGAIISAVLGVFRPSWQMSCNVLPYFTMLSPRFTDTCQPYTILAALGGFRPSWRMSCNVFAILPPCCR